MGSISLYSSNNPEVPLLSLLPRFRFQKPALLKKEVEIGLRPILELNLPDTT